MVRRQLLPTVAPNLWRLSKFGYNAGGLHESVRSLPHRWADLMGSPVPQDLGVERQSVEHYMLPLHESERGQFGLDDTDATHLPHIPSTPGATHPSSSPALCAQSREKPVVECRAAGSADDGTLPVCVSLGRMRWEQIEVPQQLFAKQRRLWHVSPQISCDWLPQDLPHIATSRLFGLECLQSYHQCLSFAKKMDGEGRLFFPIWQIASGRKVEWTLELKTSAGCARLQWWSHTAYPTRQIAPQHPDRAFDKPSRELLCLAC